MLSGDNSGQRVSSDTYDIAEWFDASTNADLTSEDFPSALFDA
jgi:hypothetical protein